MHCQGVKPNNPHKLSFALRINNISVTEKVRN